MLQAARQLLLVGVLLLVGFLGTGVALESAARIAAPEQPLNSCSLAAHHHEFFKPSCISKPMKMAEGPWLQYATNECGYRTAEPCTRRDPNQLRVAVVGTSVSYGLWVPYPQTWAARVTDTLRNGCRRPVDLQNLSFAASHDGPTALWHDLVETAPKAMALEPDAIVTILGPGDLGFYHGPLSANPGVVTGPGHAPAPPPHKSLKERLIDGKVAVNASSSVSMFRHWWLSDRGRLVDVYALPGDSNDFLRTPTPPAWRQRLTIADDAFANLAATAKARNVPWIVLLAPTVGQAALAAQGGRPGFDPYLLGSELRGLVESRGGVFYDLTGDFAHEKRLEHDFYIVNGHPTGDGNVVIARRVAALLTQDVPAFASCAVAR
jgi:hypothetical protein